MQSGAFVSIAKHRNRAVHFKPDDKRHHIIRELFIAWTYFAEFLEANPRVALDGILAIKEELKKETSMLTAEAFTRFQEIENPESDTEITECDSCSHVSVTSKYYGNGALLRLTCQSCYHWKYLAKLECEQECTELDLERFCESGNHYSNKIGEALLEEEDRNWCADCEDQVVVHIGPNDVVCTECYGTWDSWDEYDCPSCLAVTYGYSLTCARCHGPFRD